MRFFTGLVLALFVATAQSRDAASQRKRPIVLDQSGGFQIGGTIISDPTNPSATLSCDHGYMEYFIPSSPRSTSIVMWHSSSTQVWQNRWDGGEGFKDMFLRRDYPVYLWDGPRVGRANWGCASSTYVPRYADSGNFAAWNLGPFFKRFWPGVQFPTQDNDAWEQATSARYVEYDTAENVQLQSDAAAVAADSGKLGENIVYLTNSAGGLRALMTAVKSNTTNIKGIVMYECIGDLYPDNSNTTAGRGGFGPFVVPLKDFKKLANISIQFVWGDNRPDDWMYVRQSRRVASLINLYGGNAQVVKLKEDVGFIGNTHMPFKDMNNDRVAGLLDDFLRVNQLDDYADTD